MPDLNHTKNNSKLQLETIAAGAVARRGMFSCNRILVAEKHSISHPQDTDG